MTSRKQALEITTVLAILIAAAGIARATPDMTERPVGTFAVATSSSRPVERLGSNEEWPPRITKTERIRTSALEPSRTTEHDATETESEPQVGFETKSKSRFNRRPEPRQEAKYQDEPDYRSSRRPEPRQEAKYEDEPDSRDEARPTVHEQRYVPRYEPRYESHYRSYRSYHYGRYEGFASRIRHYGHRFHGRRLGFLRRW